MNTIITIWHFIKDGEREKKNHLTPLESRRWRNPVHTHPKLNPFSGQTLRMKASTMACIDCHRLNVIRWPTIAGQLSPSFLSMFLPHSFHFLVNPKLHSNLSLSFTHTPLSYKPDQPYLSPLLTSVKFEFVVRERWGIWAFKRSTC